MILHSRQLILGNRQLGQHTIIKTPNNQLFYLIAHEPECRIRAVNNFGQCLSLEFAPVTTQTFRNTFNDEKSNARFCHMYASLAMLATLSALFALPISIPFPPMRRSLSFQIEKTM